MAPIIIILSIFLHIFLRINSFDEFFFPPINIVTGFFLVDYLGEMPAIEAFISMSSFLLVTHAADLFPVLGVTFETVSFL